MLFFLLTPCLVVAVQPLEWIPTKKATIVFAPFFHMFFCLYQPYLYSVFHRSFRILYFVFRGAISILRQFLAAESLLKMIKNSFYFASKAVFVLKIFKFLSWLFGHVAKWLDKKENVNFKLYGVTAWLTNNCNTNIA